MKTKEVLYDRFVEAGLQGEFNGPSFADQEVKIVVVGREGDGVQAYFATRRASNQIPIEIESGLFVVGETVVWSVPLGYLLYSYLCYHDEGVRDRWLRETSQFVKKFLPDPVYRYAERRLRDDKD